MQQDLFQISSISNSPFETKGSILEKYRITLRLDHVLILMIILVIAYSFIFSMGVEKGKQSSMSQIHAATDRLERELKARQLTPQETSEPVAAAVPAHANKVSVTTQAAAPVVPAVTAVPTVAVESEPARLDPAPEKKAPPLTNQYGTARPEGRYTVQLVTYNKDELAIRQLRKLEEHGYQGFIVPSGSLKQVCVNAFDSRRAANRFLSGMKEGGLAPSDAYVRNMPA